MAMLFDLQMLQFDELQFSFLLLTRDINKKSLPANHF